MFRGQNDMVALKRRKVIKEHTESLIANLEQVFVEGKKLRETADMLRRIADDLDDFHRKSTEWNFFGSIAGVTGGLLGLGGLLLAPVTAGVSLVAVGAGFGASAVGGTVAAGAILADAINSKIDQDKVEGHLKGCQESLEKIKQDVQVVNHLAEEIRDLAVAVDMDVAGCVGNLGVGCGQAGLHFTKLVKTLQVLDSGRLLVKVAGLTTVVFSAAFVVFDLLILIKSSKELRRGAPSELASAIRKAESELRAGVTELQLAVIEQNVHGLRASLAE
ncbi:apolipoprotein L3-like [Pleurodeles waltl]|uniref:apolipoprotein L3-like n=1 Tax=Pleurodeles waltl TaxID=8319 RepID=UPI00370971F8